jgi:hypothetical protein
MVAEARERAEAVLEIDVRAEAGGAAASNTASMKVRSMSLWKRSLIKLTKIIRGFFQSTGCFSLDGQSVRSKPCS